MQEFALFASLAFAFFASGSPFADTSSLEAEIDRMVYALYDPTSAEIAIVECRLNGTGARVVLLV